MQAFPIRTARCRHKLFVHVIIWQRYRFARKSADKQKNNTHARIPKLCVAARVGAVCSWRLHREIGNNLARLVRFIQPKRVATFCCYWRIDCVSNATPCRREIMWKVRKVGVIVKYLYTCKFQPEMWDETDHDDIDWLNGDFLNVYNLLDRHICTSIYSNQRVWIM